MKHSNLIFGILLVAFLVSCKKTEMEENKEPSISSSHSYQRSYSVELAPFEKSSLENLINQTNI